MIFPTCLSPKGEPPCPPGAKRRGVNPRTLESPENYMEKCDPVNSGAVISARVIFMI
jgi:hypothetical protein